MTELVTKPSHPSRWALVVEDYGPMRRLLSRLLADSFRVREVASCEEALALLGRGDPPFDVVLLDIGFPEGQLQGDATLRRIKDTWPAQPVVMLSVHDEDNLVRACREAGAADYVCKEIRDPSLLAYRVVRAVEIERHRHTLAAARQRRTPWLEASPDPPGPPAATPLPVRPLEVRRLDEVLREEVELALETCGGNLSEAALRLGVDLLKLRQLMILLGLERLPRGQA